MVGEPKIDYREEKPYLGIRTQVPMRGMSASKEKLFKELTNWLKAHNIKPEGVPFLRFHVIDMKGLMDIEVGTAVEGTHPGDERVKPATLPAGRYANLIYSGSGLTGNKALIEWARAKGLDWDRWDDAKGDAFRARYESSLTDPKTERLKTKWEIEVAIKLADDPPA